MGDADVNGVVVPADMVELLSLNLVGVALVLPVIFAVVVILVDVSDAKPELLPVVGVKPVVTEVSRPSVVGAWVALVRSVSLCVTLVVTISVVEAGVVSGPFSGVVAVVGFSQSSVVVSSVEVISVVFVVLAVSDVVFEKSGVVVAVNEDDEVVLE